MGGRGARRGSRHAHRERATANPYPPEAVERIERSCLQRHAVDVSLLKRHPFCWPEPGGGGEDDHRSVAGAPAMASNSARTQADAAPCAVVSGGRVVEAVVGC